MMKVSCGQSRAARQSRLRAMVGHARGASRWHAPRLADLDVERMTVDDLRGVPVMTKHDLMTHFDAIVTDPRLTRAVVERHLDGLVRDAYLFDEYHACASGGSSGMRGVFVYDRDGWATVFVSFLRFFAQRMAEVLRGETSLMAIVTPAAAGGPGAQA